VAEAIVDRLEPVQVDHHQGRPDAAPAHPTESRRKPFLGVPSERGGAPMNVDGILRAKGARVVTIRPDATVTDLVRGLRDERIGAMVVSADGHHVDGIVSERDVVRALADRGPAAIEARVSDIMTTAVTTCSLGDDVKSLMDLMTRHRIRHIPVVQGNVIAGIVSIGDVVKSRLDEIGTETSVLREAYLGAR
jgi:CBS domain-containing protein